jgi:hypothetical protein
MPVNASHSQPPQPEVPLTGEVTRQAASLRISVTHAFLCRAVVYASAIAGKR